MSGTTLPTVVTNFGITDYNGNFSTTGKDSSYGLNNGSQVYVVIAGQQSNTATLNGSGNCSYYNNCYNNGTITFSPSSLTLNSGQNSTVDISNNNNYYGSSYYISNNSNSSVATASISGSSMYVYGNSSGNTTITVCQSSSSSACGYFYVTVNGSYCNNGSGCTGGITFSINNPNLSVGQSLNVTVTAPYIYSGSYYISNNSNSSIVNASLSGNVINLYGQSSGNSSITVCQSGTSNTCGYLYVTVNGGGYNNGSITVNPSSLNLSTGQSSTVYISGNNYYSGSYYVFSNSNSNVATATINGSSMYIFGNNSGSTTVTVCQSGYTLTCTALYVDS